MSANAVLKRPSSRGSLLLLLGLSLILIFSILLAAVSYGGLPLSKHAPVNHADEKWNAASVAEYFDSGKCTPKEYSCVEQDYRVAYCEMNGKKSIGLLVGLTVNRIITGFMGNTSYWANRCTQ